jgi:hypothetical protein
MLHLDQPRFAGLPIDDVGEHRAAQPVPGTHHTEMRDMGGADRQEFGGVEPVGGRQRAGPNETAGCASSRVPAGSGTAAAVAVSGPIPEFRR